ncbi:MAG: hypothetical protein ABL925_14995, partial [Methylococcales bacterium]
YLFSLINHTEEDALTKNLSQGDKYPRRFGVFRPGHSKATQEPNCLSQQRDLSQNRQSFQLRLFNKA